MRKKLLGIILLATLAACESERPEGKCIGLNGKPKPGVEYEYSTGNIIVGVVFMEMIAPPIIVLLDELKCPVSANAS